MVQKTVEQAIGDLSADVAALPMLQAIVLGAWL